MKIKQLFLNQSLTSKFRIIYVVTIILCILCNVFITQFFYQREADHTITQMAYQTLQTISKNAEQSISTISKSSTYILGGSDVQNYLNSITLGQVDTILSKQLRNSLYLSLESMPLVSSILIVSESGVYEYAARYSLPKILLTAPNQASWYKQVHSLQGLPLFLHNGGGYFAAETECLSLIRLIRSTEDAAPLGYLIINIPLSSLFSINNDDTSNYTDICVYSPDSIILNFMNNDLAAQVNNIVKENITTAKSMMINQDRYMFTIHYSDTLGWNYLCATKYTPYSRDLTPFILICLFTILISGVLFLFIAFCLSRFVTTPLHRLSIAMKKTEQGNFKPTYVTSYTDELGQLQDTFNGMVHKIQELLDAKILEQKLLRKSELRVLQAQIKPHFLYNTLSGIAFLISSRQNDDACELVISLSEYYRESLSKGNEFITLSTEINIVKNYLKLQKMRYKDMFDDIYEIQEGTLGLLIPKLTIQPLVENSLYHGLLPTGEGGTIIIRIYIKEHDLIIHIKDDGMGMTDEEIAKNLDGAIALNKKSFGLRGTVERLQLFFEKKEIYQIISSPGKGTEIIFLLPIKEMEASHGTE